MDVVTDPYESSKRFDPTVLYYRVAVAGFSNRWDTLLYLLFPNSCVAVRDKW